MSEVQTITHSNDLMFSNKVLEKIAYQAIKKVDGIIELKSSSGSDFMDFFSNNEDATRGINAEVGKEEVALDFEMIVEFGKNISTTYERAVAELTNQIKTMTGLNVTEINMKVTDIMTYAEYEKDKTAGERKKANDRYLANLNGEYSDGRRVR